MYDIILLSTEYGDGEVHMKEEYEKYRHDLTEYVAKKIPKIPIIPIAFLLAGMRSGTATASVPEISTQLANYMKNKQEPFNKCLFQMIDKKGLKDSDVYKQAGLTRQMFSKIRCKKDYTPTKAVMLSLAVGMHLSVEETEQLLASGNQLLSRSDTGDLIVRFFMEQGEYDLDLYNAYLFEYHQHLLGSIPKEQ